MYLPLIWVMVDLPSVPLEKDLKSVTNQNLARLESNCDIEQLMPYLLLKWLYE